MFRRDKDDPPVEPKNDVALRRAGFRIHSRPKRGEAIWVRDGEFFLENEAHHVRDVEARAK